MMPAMSVIFRRKLKEERSLPRSNKKLPKSSTIKQIVPSSCRCAQQEVKKVKVNALKCVNF